MNRIGVFLDVRNLYYNIRKRHEGKVLDFKFLFDNFNLDGKDLIVINAINVIFDDKANKFMAALRHIGYGVDFKQSMHVNINDPTVRAIAQNEENTVMLIANVLRYLSRLDEIYLASANKNLCPFVDYLKSSGVTVHIIGCNIPNELRSIADTWTEFREEFLKDDSFTKTTE